MTNRPRYPVVALGVSLVLILLFAFGPTAVLLIGGLASDALGCRMPIDGTAGACLVMGIDVTPVLSFAVLCGYLAFLTLPAGVPLLGLWLVAAVVAALVWSVRRRNASSGGPRDTA